MINRYSQPIQQQYIPTGPNPQMMEMMLRKRESEKAQMEQQAFQLENNMLGVKAFNKEDSDRLKNRVDYYTKALDKIYTQYRNNPHAGNAYLGKLNREYMRDIQSGELYDINKNYSIASEDVADANKREGEGKLNPWAAQWQRSNAGSGRRAQEGKDFMKDAMALVSGTDYSNSIYDNKEEAARTAVESFIEDNKLQLSYMPEEQRMMTIESFENHFYNKYRNDRIKGNDDAGVRVQKSSASITGHFKPYEIDETAFDGSGWNNNYKAGINVSDANLPRDAYFNPDVMDKIKLSLQKEADINHKAKITEIDNLIDKHGIDKTKPKAEQIAELNDIKTKLNAHYGSTITIDNPKELGFTLQKLSDLQATGAKITDEDGNEIEDLINIKSESLPAIRTIDGALIYSIVDADDKPMKVYVTGHDQNIETGLAPYKTIVDGISQGNIGHDSKIRVGGFFSKTTKDGSSNSRYENVSIVPMDERNDYIIYPLDENGEKIPYWDSSKGKNDGYHNFKLSEMGEEAGNIIKGINKKQR